MIGVYAGVLVGASSAVLGFRTLVNVRRSLEDWREEFGQAISDDGSGIARAAAVDALLAELERRLAAESTTAGVAARLSLVAGAALALAMGLQSGWREGLSVLPGATLGAMTSLWLGKLRSTRVHAARAEADLVVERDAAELLKIDVPQRRRRRSWRARRR